MIRTPLVIVRAAGSAAAAIAALALVACAPPVTPAPCPPAVQAKVKDQLRTATSITCRTHRAEAATADIAVGDIDRVEALAAFPDGRTASVDITTDGKTIQSITYTHNDLVASSSKSLALMFWLFAFATVGGAVFVVSRRNLIAAVMGMVGSFLGIAAIYMMLYAQFLAIVQMLVYAGAIMVLFVFVVMILNRPEDEPVAPAGRAGQAIGGLAILYLVGRLIMMLVRVQPPNVDLANAAPLPTAQGHDWGTIGAVGTDLFGPGLFPFEAISVLLLVAVVGAIAIARPLRPGGDNAGDDNDPLAGDAPSHPEGGAA